MLRGAALALGCTGPSTQSSYSIPHETLMHMGFVHTQTNPINYPSIVQAVQPPSVHSSSGIKAP